jgi:gamma-glutamylaminecyclotransferase
MNNEPLVFVYGTLKRGKFNHAILLELGAEFICRATTCEAYPLVVEGLPFLLDSAGNGFPVAGEIFRLDGCGLSFVDRLERHPDWYRRREIDLTGDDGKHYRAWAYFHQRHPGGLTSLQMIAEY